MSMPTGHSNLELPAVPHPSWTLANLGEWCSSFETAALERTPELRAHHFAILKQAIDKLLDKNTPFSFSPEELGRETGISARTLQRIFETEVGLSLRDTSRIIRFNRTIKEIADRDTNSIADAGAACGFFDQAHLNREFRNLTKKRPTEFKTYF